MTIETRGEADPQSEKEEKKTHRGARNPLGPSPNAGLTNLTDLIGNSARPTENGNSEAGVWPHQKKNSVRYLRGRGEGPLKLLESGTHLLDKRSYFDEK